MTASSGAPEAKSTQPILSENPLSAQVVSDLVESSGQAILPSAEKRRVERTPTDQLLYVELGTGNGGIVLNVSEEGCSFLAIAPMWEQNPHFSFAIGSGRQVRGDANVVWVDESKKLGGLCFVDPSPAFREQVRTWLAELKAAPSVSSEAEPAPEADILGPIPPRFDSPAKQRRKQLREEARAKLKAELEESDRSRAGQHKAQLDQAQSALQPEIESAQAEKDLQIEWRPLQPDVLSTEKSEVSLTAEYGLPSRGRQKEREHPQSFFSTAHIPEIPGPHPGHGVWKRVAAIALGAALAALAVAFHEQAGRVLMQIGTRLAGTPSASVPVSDSSTAPPRQPEAPQPREAVQANPASTENKEPAAAPEFVPESAADAQKSGSQSNRVNTQIASQGTADEDVSQKTELPASAPKAERKFEPQPKGQAPSAASMSQNSTSPPKSVMRERKASHASAAQVQALWSEVETGDTQAAITLADYYARGNGVPKSCGQARMLLSSAAKKGSDEARQKLDQLSEAGCL